MVKEAIKETMIKPAMSIVQEHYNDGLKSRDITNITKATVEKAEKIIDKAYTNYEIDNKRIEVEKKEELKKCETSQQKAEVEKKFEAKKESLKKDLITTVNTAKEEIIENVQKDTIKAIEVNKKETAKKDEAKEIQCTSYQGNQSTQGICQRDDL